MFLRCSCALLVLTFVNLPLAAQETPKVEIFGGYSYNNFDEFGTINLNGWNAAVSWNANRWLSFVGDFSGHYGTEQLTITIAPDPPIQLRIRRAQHTFLLGPRFSFRLDKRFTPFVHTLFGVARFRRESTPSSFFGFKETGLGVSLGGGIDVNVNNRLAVRVIQADLQILRTDIISPHNFRYSAGLVFRFGR